MSKTPEANDWIRSAENDWLVIRNELRAEEKPWSMIAFHAEQAAEKYLKAFLIRNGERPLRTHDLEGLLKICARFDDSLAVFAEDCDALTEFAIDARYEDFIEYNSEPVARRAVAASERVCSAIRERIL
ncbi:MAG TPA: HEPN domain-containing protein [Candidatus Kapabacteria bacterium]|nr:HEPN domain-containing protein [Candidatus Kapabacteria bacterium]